MAQEKEFFLLIKAIIASFEGDREEKEELLKGLSQVLKKQKKEYLLPKFFDLLEKTYLKKKRIDLTLAREHSAEVAAELIECLKNKFGQEKEIFISYDSSLIGGFRAKGNNFLIKASVQDFLGDLKIKYANTQ